MEDARRDEPNEVTQYNGWRPGDEHSGDLSTHKHKTTLHDRTLNNAAIDAGECMSMCMHGSATRNDINYITTTTCTNYYTVSSSNCCKGRPHCSTSDPVRVQLDPCSDGHWKTPPVVSCNLQRTEQPAGNPSAGTGAGQTQHGFGAECAVSLRKAVPERLSAADQFKWRPAASRSGPRTDLLTWRQRTGDRVALLPGSKRMAAQPGGQGCRGRWCAYTDPPVVPPGCVSRLGKRRVGASPSATGPDVEFAHTSFRREALQDPIVRKLSSSRGLPATGRAEAIACPHPGQLRGVAGGVASRPVWSSVRCMLHLHCRSSTCCRELVPTYSLNDENDKKGKAHQENEDARVKGNEEGEEDQENDGQTPSPARKGSGLGDRERGAQCTSAIQRAPDHKTLSMSFLETPVQKVNLRNGAFIPVKTGKVGACKIAFSKGRIQKFRPGKLGAAAEDLKLGVLDPVKSSN